jgi:MFS family permease
MADADYTPGDHYPAFKMFILATVVFSSAISVTGLFPYIGFMTIHMGLAANTDEAGYYSGWIASSMMFGRFITSFYWGTVADRIGRKPVLAIGCVAVAAFSLLFGVSTNFLMAMAARFLLGFFNPM